MIPLPHLPTLHRRPSWTNLAGRIDRSACLEIRASELRRPPSCNPKPGRSTAQARVLPKLEAINTPTLDDAEHLHIPRPKLKRPRRALQPL